MKDRRWRQDAGGQSKDYLGHHVFRHADLFADAKAAAKILGEVPFLNGGLFECLDVEITEAELQRRLSEWQPPQPHYATGVFAKYAKLVSSASEGAVTR